MAVQRGSIFTPDKKKLLVDELQREISSLQGAIKQKTGEAADKLKKIDADLNTRLNNLYEKKGVVTPQETDDILDAIASSKRTRLEADYFLGLKKGTIYLLAFLGIGIGLYWYNKKRG